MKTPPTTLYDWVDRSTLTLLLATLTLVALPHFNNLDPVIYGWFFILLGWRYLALRHERWLPGRVPLFLLTFLSGALVITQYHIFWGHKAGTSLFLMGLGLKLMELKTVRDIYLVIYLAYFVALTQYLFSQDIAMAAYTLLIVWLITTVLISVNSSSSFPWRARFHLAGTLLLQTIPLVIVLFVFFPRAAGPLWHIPQDERHARTGLSDSMEPGAIGRLSLSDETAFRVNFNGEPPPRRQWYWRGPVFWHTDGSRWDMPQGKYPQSLLPEQRPRLLGQAYRYTLVLEPHEQNWVLALDMPGGYPKELQQTRDYDLRTRIPVHERQSFQLSSNPDYRTGPLSETQLQQGLYLPKQALPRLQQLVTELRARSRDDEDLVRAVLAYFHDQPFTYTLNPPPMPVNPIETFLFDIRRGFCEHYATAFVYLLRSAGIPARIVTGYQGGEWNPVGKFIEVRQADVHAWAEYWSPDSGWQRADPTAAVAPERIERGFDLERQISVGDVMFNTAQDLAQRLGPWQRFNRQSELWWASIDHSWHLWILGYGQDQQRLFWALLGILDYRQALFWLIMLGGTCIVFVAMLVMAKRRPRLEESIRLYQQACRKLAKHGLFKQPGEGALQFAARVSEKNPQLAEHFQAITRVYYALRYSRHPPRQGMRALRRLVRQLSI